MFTGQTDQKTWPQMAFTMSGGVIPASLVQKRAAEVIDTYERANSRWPAIAGERTLQTAPHRVQRSPKITRCPSSPTDLDSTMHKAFLGFPGSVVSLPDAAGGRCFTAMMPRDHPASAVAAYAGCAASWRGLGGAHCRECHLTFDDRVLFDAHRRTGSCVPPQCLDLVTIGGVWCRLLAGEQTTAC
jgi:hypothetical protein